MEQIVMQFIYSDYSKDKYLLGTVYSAHCPFRSENESRCSNINITNQKQGRRLVQRATTKKKERDTKIQIEIFIKTEREEEKKEITKTERNIIICIFVRDTPSRF